MTEEEFRKLCDEHRLSRPCERCNGEGQIEGGTCSCNREYPTLEQLLDRFEEKWAKPQYLVWVKFQYNYRKEHWCFSYRISDERGYVGAMSGKEDYTIGEKKLAVLRALVGERR